MCRVNAGVNLQVLGDPTSHTLYTKVHDQLAQIFLPDNLQIFHAFFIICRFKPKSIKIVTFQFFSDFLLFSPFIKIPVGLPSTPRYRGDHAGRLAEPLLTTS